VRSLYHDGMVRIVVTPNSGRSVSTAEQRAVARVGWITHASTPTAAHGVCEVRQEMSRWDVENPLAAPSPE
jgi:hypothetical protein